MNKLLPVSLLFTLPLMSFAVEAQDEDIEISDTVLDSWSYSEKENDSIYEKERTCAAKVLETMKRIGDMSGAMLYSIELFNQLQEWDRMCVEVDAYTEKHGVTKTATAAASAIEAHTALIDAENARLIKSDYYDHPLSDALKLHALYSLHNPKSCFEQHRHKYALVLAGNLEYGYYLKLNMLTDAVSGNSQPAVYAKQIHQITESYAIFVDKARLLGLPGQKRRDDFTQKAIRQLIVDINSHIGLLKKANWQGCTELEKACEFAQVVINEQIGR